jgi:manganese/zinc/iron transport system substrate-binding protein
MSHLRYATPWLAAILLFLAGCNEEIKVADVVTTTAMVGDIVHQVAGDRLSVESIMGPRSDPHEYHPTRDDAYKLRRAKMVFYSGLMLEGQMTHMFENLKSQGRPIHAVTDKLDKVYEVRYPAEGHPDPHVWMDVQGWGHCVGFVAEALAEYDPDHADEYRANAAQYRKQLDLLDAYAREVIQSIPKEQRVLVTAHDAFAYFSRTYGIEVRAPQGVDTTQEASIGDINKLVDFLVERKIPVLFTEESVNDKNLSAIISGAADKGWTVRKAEGQLFSDSMGAAGTHEGSYIGMIDHNATLIAKELGGSPPEGGFRAWLEQRQKK